MLHLMICSLLHIPCIITFQLLADLENSSMFTGDLECQKLLMEAMKYHLLPERRPMMQSPRTRPRKSTVGALYAIGGMDAMKGKRGKLITLQFSSVQSLSCVRLCVTPASQYARPPCPSPNPRVYSNSCPSSR